MRALKPYGKFIYFNSAPLATMQVWRMDPDGKNRTELSYNTVEGYAKVIGYLNGGRGTINVPIWSPDNKKIAFISNGCFVEQ